MLGRCVGAVALLFALAPAVATAQATRVVMTQLEGRNAAAARRVLVDGLRERGLTVTEVDASPSSDAEAAAVIGDAQAIVGGTAAARGGGWRVGLWVRDASGGMQGEVRRRVRGARGVRRVVGALAETLELVPTAATPSAPVAARSETVTTPGAGTDAAAGSGTVATSESAAVSEPVAASGSATESTPAPGSRSAGLDEGSEPPLFRATVLVGAGVRSRAFELLSPDGVDSGYRVEPYSELAAKGSVRFFDVLFVRASFASSIALESRAEDGGALDTWFARAFGDVGASYWIGGAVELGAAFGVGWDRYQLPFNDVVPLTEYVHLRPAFVSGFRLVGELLVLHAEVGVRIPFGVGDLTALHGSDYDVLGLDGAVRLGGVIDPGFTWSVEVGARHYWLTFTRPDGEATGFDAGWHATGYAGWTF